MQDPSYGIPKELAQHVHLISANRFPYTSRLQIHQVHQFLVEAPKIVKQHAAMAWQYLTTPQDGTVFLTWAPPRNNDMFPSDGYVWAGPEERMMQEYGGYTIEITVQHAGFKPHVDPIACHQRRRYRLVQKNPNVNASPPDRNLWIVHYSQAEQQRMLPASQITISRQQQLQFQQRSFIESQGQLEHREFMLHDRERWPQLRFTGQGRIQAVQGFAPQMPGAAPPSALPHMANQRFAPQQYQQQQQAQAGIGPSPAKRQRTSIGAATASTAAPMPEYYDVEAEEEYAMGDYLDTLNQREVSKARYLTHHEWMEEVFSSSYMTRQISPAYLGFGLMGELSGLTEGIFTTVADAVKLYTSPDEIPADQIPSAAAIPADKLQQFESRVADFMAANDAEMARMKAAHAKKMEDLRRGRALGRAEKRLRAARWAVAEGEGHSAVLNGLVSGSKGEGSEDAEAVVGEVAAELGREIVAQPIVRTVDKGGFREVLPEPVKVVEAPLVPQQQVDGPQMGQTQPPQQVADEQDSGFDVDENMETLDASAFEIEGMDLDIGSGSDFNFGDSGAGGAGTPAVAAPTAAVAAAAPTTAMAAEASGAAPVSVQEPPQQQDVDDTAFDDFTSGMDFGGEEADEELGELGMDNSAFGEAFHGDDTPGEE